jgi:hypothetical protein
MKSKTQSDTCLPRPRWCQPRGGFHQDSEEPSLGIPAPQQWISRPTDACSVCQQNGQLRVIKNDTLQRLRFAAHPSITRLLGVVLIRISQTTSGLSTTCWVRRLGTIARQIPPPAARAAPGSDNIPI